MMTSPEVNWLFFKARAKRPYLSHTGRASNAEKQPTGHGPEGCDENGPAAALLVGYVSIRYAPSSSPAAAKRPPDRARRLCEGGREARSKTLAIPDFGSSILTRQRRAFQPFVFPMQHPIHDDIRSRHKEDQSVRKRSQNRQLMGAHPGPIPQAESNHPEQ